MLRLRRNESAFLAVTPAPKAKAKSRAGCFLLFLALTLALALHVSHLGFDHDEKLIGPYRLTAVDMSEQMSVDYGLDGGSAIVRITETVFSVGWDERYIVAKQHPKNDRSITNYFYLVIADDSPYANPAASVRGPFTAEEFAQKKKKLGLPDFTRTIKSLE